MFKILIEEPSGAPREFICSNESCQIGRSADNDIVLSGWRIGKSHAQIVREEIGLVVHDLGSLLGTSVNNNRVAKFGPLTPGDEIMIGTFKLRVRDKAPRTVVPNSDPAITAPSDYAAASTDMFLWRKKIHEEVLQTIDLRRTDVSRMSDEDLRRQAETLIREILAEQADDIPAEIAQQDLVKDVLDEAVGLGPLEKLLADDAVTEIMVNRADEIFVERKGRLERTKLCFTTERAVMSVIERIVAPLGRRIDESSPMVDARLKDGSRVNAIIPPLSLRGPTLTIRKFAKHRFGIEEMVEFNSISPEMADFLRVCVERRKSIVVSGGTGSGKTTLLNVLSNFIPKHERIVTIEDAAELRLEHPHLVSLEARPMNLEGRGQISIRDLVRNSLRMRPDRIVVGECRGGEALDMLQAMNTGHDGSLTTAHANSPRDLLSRLEVMVLMAGMEMPINAIREQVASAVDIIVHQSRFSCGSRKVTHISEVTGVEGNKIQLQDIFTFRQQGTDRDGRILGHYAGCGFIPNFYEGLARIGVPVDLSIFGNSQEAA